VLHWDVRISEDMMDTESAVVKEEVLLSLLRYVKFIFLTTDFSKK
jgi:superfamily II RNA helicase